MELCIGGRRFIHQFETILMTRHPWKQQMKGYAGNGLIILTLQGSKASSSHFIQNQHAHSSLVLFAVLHQCWIFSSFYQLIHCLPFFDISFSYKKTLYKSTKFYINLIQQLQMQSLALFHEKLAWTSKRISNWVSKYQHSHYKHRDISIHMRMPIG